MTKNEIKTAIENAAATIDENEFTYVESVSNALGLDPEYSGVIVERRDNGIVVYIDNGEVYPTPYGVEEFANVYGE